MSHSRLPWTWTRRFAVGLSASVAGFSAFNFITPFLPREAAGIPVADLLAGMLLAAIVGNAQGLANCSAANARRVGAAGRRGAEKWCWAFCMGFAATSWFGLHNAWEMVEANASGYAFPDPLLMDVLFAFIAIAEPTTNWVVDLLKSLHEADARQQEHELREVAATREMRQRDADARRKVFHTVAAPMAAVAIAAAPLANTAEATQLDHPLDPVSHSAPQDAKTEGHRAHGWRGPRDQKRWERFVEADELGMAPTEIIKETGLPSTTVYRWKKLKDGGASFLQSSQRVINGLGAG
ncbi:MAG: hypothetical protein KF779_14600 [Hyphomonadaceae bacterium]|nr:hypothetical protein [Hyphomonadaceae bacterium]